MINIIQGNMNRGRAADLLIEQLCHEKRIHLAILSEHNRNRDGSCWFVDHLNTAAIWVIDSRVVSVEKSGAGQGYVWVLSRGTIFISCYLSPNDSIDGFRTKLESLEDFILGSPNDLVVAGDFNARAYEWGMPTTNTRGRLLLEMAARVGLLVVNVGNTPTFQRPGYGSSIPDVTLVSESLINRVQGWQVMDDYSGSDHNYISFQMRNRLQAQMQQRYTPRRYNVSLLDEARFTEALRTHFNRQHLMGEPLDREGTEDLAKATMLGIKEACDSSMPYKRRWQGRTQAYWWSEEIAELRRRCLYLRRRAQRTRNRQDGMELSAQHKHAKKLLVRAIRDSKQRCWRKLCDEVNENPWGEGYKIVMKKLSRNSPQKVLSATKMSNIVDSLFPAHPVQRHHMVVVDPASIPTFTEENLKNAVALMKNGKAPGPDGIPVEAIKKAVHTEPQQLLRVYNACLKNGVFPKQWKVARLFLLSKGKADPNCPSSFRPLCMLDMGGKLLERLLKPLLNQAIDRAGGLSEKQHGFRKGHSTVNAIMEVIEVFKSAQRPSHPARPLVLLVTLDVRNAFNTVRWSTMLEALEHQFAIPGYLLNILKDYLRDRRLVYETEEGWKEKIITAGAAQGSILGPDLWNVAYNSLLQEVMPTGARLIAYADDVAAVISGRSLEMTQLTLNQVMRRVSRWMADHGLELAMSKTEILILTRRRVPTLVPMTIGNEEVHTHPTAKYLGLTLDTRLTFWPHIQKVCKKAAKVTQALSALMANVGGPSPGKRRLLMLTAQAAMLYGAEIWAEAVKVQKYRTQLASVQRRGALRIASAYRTVSEAAALVVAGVTPIDLLVLERKSIFDHSGELGRAEAASQAHERTMFAWQQRWEAGTTGRWTAVLIKNIRAWTERQHGEVGFFLTQFLTGHGYFRSYLFVMGKVASPKCALCGAEWDDAKHTFFQCLHFQEEREEVSNRLGELSADSIIGKMLMKKELWSIVASYVEGVLRQKKNEGCLIDQL